MNRSLKKPLIGLLLSAVIAVFPLILVSMVKLIANLSSCRLTEGSVEPCIIAGMDVSGILNNLLMSGWYLFITFPIGGVLFFGSLIWLTHIYLNR
ncbi:hypothetical protein ACKGJO_02485 [Gracilimonas sp. Q87]|uniref:hypothetical protein n=1 Tax=Gracilimonas sp. Q87 TaxID=3384766 RepID=UPI003983FA4E